MAITHTEQTTMNSLFNSWVYKPDEPLKYDDAIWLRDLVRREGLIQPTDTSINGGFSSSGSRNVEANAAGVGNVSISDKDRTEKKLTYGSGEKVHVGNWALGILHEDKTQLVLEIGKKFGETKALTRNENYFLKYDHAGEPVALFRSEYVGKGRKWLIFPTRKYKSVIYKSPVKSVEHV